MPKVCIFSSVHQALDNRIFYREARSLQKAGYDVVLIARHTHREIKDGIQIIPLPTVPKWQRPILWLRILREAVNSESKVFHFHDPELLLVSPFIRLLTKQPTIYDIHESTSDFMEIKDEYPVIVRNLLSRLTRKLEPLLASRENGLIFADEQIASSYTSFKKPKTILYNFPERSFIEKAIKNTNTTTHRPPIILYLGGIKRNRGTDLIINAFEKVVKIFPEANLYLVGPFSPPSLKDEMLARFSRIGIDRSVKITDRIPFELVDEYLGNAMVGWIPFPSVTKYQKNIPTKLFEYMAYALPVVSSDLTPVRQFVIDQQNGYLVPPNDSNAHANAIVHLLNNPQHALAMGRYGQKLVQTQYTWDEMESRLISLYQELLC